MYDISMQSHKSSHFSVHTKKGKKSFRSAFHPLFPLFLYYMGERTYSEITKPEGGTS